MWIRIRISEYRSGSTKLLNSNPIWIRIHSTETSESNFNRLLFFYLDKDAGPVLREAAEGDRHHQQHHPHHEGGGTNTTSQSKWIMDAGGMIDCVTKGTGIIKQEGLTRPV